MTRINAHFHSLISTVRQLRSDQGCPWDRKQTTASLKKHLVEEFDEIIAAIDHDDPENLCEELGDFLYLIVMIGEINRENGSFTIEEVIETVNRKLIRRHPHVFSSKKDLDEKELRRQWNAIKKKEKDLKNIS